jgi:putative ABC transport system permease protein
MLTALDWVVLRANSWPQDLYLVGYRNKQQQTNLTNVAHQLQAYKEQTASAFDAIAYASPQQLNVAYKDSPVSTGVLGVSANLLGVLGITPAIGRDFNAGDDADGRTNVIIVSDQFWRRHMGARPDALGALISIDGVPHAIIGVLKKEQILPASLASDVFRPVRVKVDDANPWGSFFFTIAKLKGSASQTQGEQLLATADLKLSAQWASFFVDQKPILLPLRELQKVARPDVYFVLLAAVGCLFGIACLNSANLVLVRQIGRGRENAIRSALGASQWGVTRLVVLESVILAIVSLIGGFVLSKWFLPIFLQLAGTGLPFTPNIWTIDFRIAVIFLALGGITMVGIAFFPLLWARWSGLDMDLRIGGGLVGEVRSLSKARIVLVAAQVALTFLLIYSAGLMIQTFQRASRVQLGFDSSGRIKVILGFSPSYASDADSRVPLMRRLQERIEGIQGVTGVAFSNDVLLPGYCFPSLALEGADGAPIQASLDTLSDGFEKVAGLQLRAGSWPKAGSSVEVVINESLAKMRFPMENPVGKFIKPANAPKQWTGWMIVGVVNNLRESLRGTNGYHVYGPTSWAPLNLNTFVIRTAPNAVQSVILKVRQTVFEADSRIVVSSAIPLPKVLEGQLQYETFVLSVLKILSVMSALLTGIGISGTMLYMVGERKSEFGVRLAMGASHFSLVALILRRSALILGTGIFAGLICAMWLSRFLESLLFDTPPMAPVTLVATGMLLFVVGCVACLFPAIAAYRINVTQLLRSE